MLQLVAPTSSVVRPTAQLRQAEDPSAEEYLPSAHRVDSVAPLLAALPLMVAKEPAGTIVQTAFGDVVAENLPRGQAVQTVFPIEEEKVPGAQGVIPFAPLITENPLEVVKYPIGGCKVQGEVLPVSALYLPIAQGVHVASVPEAR